MSEALSTLGVQNRIRAEMLRLARAAADEDAGSARLLPAPRHADLAAQLGTTREQVTRELSALTRDGLLQKRGGALLVTDLPRLEQLVCGRPLVPPSATPPNGNAQRISVRAGGPRP